MERCISYCNMISRNCKFEHGMLTMYQKYSSSKSVEGEKAPLLERMFVVGIARRVSHDVSRCQIELLSPSSFPGTRQSPRYRIRPHPPPQ